MKIEEIKTEFDYAGNLARLKAIDEQLKVLGRESLQRENECVKFQQTELWRNNRNVKTLSEGIEISSREMYQYKSDYKGEKCTS